MIEKQIKTFKDWGYPFIARDYAGWDDDSEEFHKKNDGLILAGAVIFDDTAEEDVNKFIEESMASNAVAVMIDFSNMENKDTFNKLRKISDEYYFNNGFEDSESYERRLSYTKVQQ